MLLINQKRLLIGLVAAGLCILTPQTWGQSIDETSERRRAFESSDGEINSDGRDVDATLGSEDTNVVTFERLVDPNADTNADFSADGGGNTDFSSDDDGDADFSANSDGDADFIGENSNNPNDPNIGGLRDTNGPSAQLRNRPRNAVPQADSNARARSANQVGTIGPDGSITPLANTRVIAEQVGTPRPVDDPFAPIGIRLGTFILSPVVTQSIGITSNADFSTGGSESAFSQTDLRLTGVSNWSLHELRGEVGGSYQTFFNGTSEDLPTLDANLELRLDHNRGFTSRFGGSYALTTENAVSDNLSVPPPLTILERPNVQRYAGYGELAKQTGRLNTSLRGTVTYSVFDGAELSNGTRLPQGDRTNTLYEARGRIGYETSPSIQPFVEANIGSRQYFRPVDRNGNQRDSMTYGLRGGLTFDRGEKLTGELSAGYATEQYVDNAINDLDGFTVDGTVNWSPQRLTTVTANLQTMFTGSTNANEAGSVTYAGTLNAVHNIRPNLSLNASVSASIQSFDGSGREDTRLQASAGTEWRINRNLGLIGTVGHEIVRSSAVGSSYEATTARLGFRWRR